jgi:hypothetical protein
MKSGVRCQFDNIRKPVFEAAVAISALSASPAAPTKNFVVFKS